MSNTPRIEEDEFSDLINFQLDSQLLKKSNDKLKSGELTCNIEDPENCENCSG